MHPAITVERAATAAAAAFRDFSHRSNAERAQLLQRIAAGIEQLGDTLISCAREETSLTAARLAAERDRTCMQLRLFAHVAEAGTWADERIDSPDLARNPTPKPRITSKLRPLGPIAVFGASNFPLAFSVAGGDTASALAVGCPVIVKAHPAHPVTSEVVADVIHGAIAACDMPRGVFSILFDIANEVPANEVGLALVRHPLIKGGAFTGSQRGGLALWRAAQERRVPIPFFAEMASANPVFIFPRALAARTRNIASGLHASITASVGQLCTKPGLIFVLDSPAGIAFLDTLSGLIAATPPARMLTRAMESSYRKGVAERSAIGRVRTCTETGTKDGAHAVLHITDADTFLQSRQLEEEIFGPCSLAVVCASADDFQRCAEILDGQLTATVWSEPDELASQPDFLWTLEQKAGRIVFDGFPTGVEVGTAMMHGGPFPATTDSRFTSVGTRSLLRFVRPLAWQTAA